MTKQVISTARDIKPFQKAAILKEALRLGGGNSTSFRRYDDLLKFVRDVLSVDTNTAVLRAILKSNDQQNGLKQSDDDKSKQKQHGRRLKRSFSRAR